MPVNRPALIISVIYSLRTPSGAYSGSPFDLKVSVDYLYYLLDVRKDYIKAPSSSKISIHEVPAISSSRSADSYLLILI